MSVKGRVKQMKKQMPGLHGQLFLYLFDERSEPGKPQVLRVSARSLPQKWHNVRKSHE